MHRRNGIDVADSLVMRHLMVRFGVSTCARIRARARARGNNGTFEVNSVIVNW